MFTPEESYKFKNIPLTPSIAEGLILETFSGQIVERHQIVDKVVQLHKSRGGRDAQTADVTRTVKKALENLKKSSQANNLSQGFWEIISTTVDLQNTNGLRDNSELSPITSLSLNAEKIVGVGTNAVYVYYFLTYRDLATINNAVRWPCKIGRSDRDPMLRVLSQASTALPERPTIALLIRTDDASSLEAALHAILILRGQRCINSPGNEWFDTTPNEVMQMLDFIQPNVYGVIQEVS